MRNDFGPRHVALTCLGILPASLLAVASFVGFFVLHGWPRLLAPASVVGTAGLVWALIRPSSRHRRIVIGMLVIGELAMLPAIVATTFRFPDSQNPLWLQIGMGWLVLGPMIAGAVFIYELLRRSADPRSS